jgi:hypothetical protein
MFGLMFGLMFGSVRLPAFSALLGPSALTVVLSLFGWGARKVLTTALEMWSVTYSHVI